MSYSIKEVAKEVATTYGAALKNYRIEGDELIVECVECGEEFIATLKLNEIDEFMSM